MNPFETESQELNSYFMNWAKMYAKPYDKETTSPFTKVRVILMNGTEFESNWYLHQFARHCTDPDIKRQIAIVRAQEQQQQKRIASLKPKNENMLETTIAYEQLAIELTAILAQNERDQDNLNALNFALLEDFDHLYRFANLLKMDYDIDADCLVGKFTEIMPGRPTISEHRYPTDNIKRSLNNDTAHPQSILISSIITAAEQQTMNFYMNLANFYKNDYGRKLFSEIALIEEQHVSQYESLKDPTCTWLEGWVMHEYVEAYLYYSMMQDETDDYIRCIWEDHFYMEIAHLKLATSLLKKYEGKEYTDLFPEPDFPKLIKFGENKEYIRKVIASTVRLTGCGEDYCENTELPEDSYFFRHQRTLNGDVECVPSHDVINRAIDKLGKDYRYQDSPHPIEELGDRKEDNTTVGREGMFKNEEE